MIEVLFTPPLTSVQDLGRDGFWYQGLGRAGAMDTLAHRVANLLLGNDENAATIECALTPAKLRFTTRQPFALVGAACGAQLDGVPLPRCYAGWAEAGAVLQLGPMQGGAHVYLALAGGVDVPQVMGSRSTQLREGFGGFQGRALAAGDQIGAVGGAVALPPQGLSLALPPLGDVITLRALPSSEHDSFEASSLEAFWSGAWQVTRERNRQGFRLEGQALTRHATGELRSHGIVPGIVQVPGGGQPIVQLADSATMGGYPKIAAVIAADLWRIAQAAPGTALRFEKVDLAEAAAADAALCEQIATIRRQIIAATTLYQSWS